MSRPETEPDLRLLLEDYGLRARQWLTRFASLPRSDQEPARRATNGAPARHLRLLIQEYSRHRDDWWRDFHEAAPSRAPALPSDDQPALRLLIEDYQPARGTPLALNEAPAEGLPNDRADSPPEEGEAAHHETEAAPEASETEAGLPGTAVPEDEPELVLEVHWDESLSLAGKRKPMALSLVVHAFLVASLLLQPTMLPLEQRPLDVEAPNFTLLSPPEDFLLELTQPEPNEGPVSVEFEGKDELPVPVMERPEEIVPAPPNPQPEPEEESAPAPAQAEQPEETDSEPPPEQRAPEPEPEPAPPLIAARSPFPGEFHPDRRLGRPSELPMPKRPSRSNQRPKLTLEEARTGSPGRAGPAQLGSLAFNARPGQIVQGAIGNLRSGRGSRQAVGDGYGTGGLGGYLPPSPGNAGSNLELLSDPMGVDFRPYLLQVLSTVRRNWFAVIPESARRGMNRGAVAIQLRIVPNGTIAKLVIANSSGIGSLDRAAVAGISASNPLPPLPTDFRGENISLQFVFRYNLKR